MCGFAVGPRRRELLLTCSSCLVDVHGSGTKWSSYRWYSDGRLWSYRHGNRSVVPGFQTGQACARLGQLRAGSSESLAVACARSGRCFAVWEAAFAHGHARWPATQARAGARTPLQPSLQQTMGDGHSDSRTMSLARCMKADAAPEGKRMYGRALECGFRWPAESVIRFGDFLRRHLSAVGAAAALRECLFDTATLRHENGAVRIPCDSLGVWEVSGRRADRHGQRGLGLELRSGSSDPPRATPLRVARPIPGVVDPAVAHARPHRAHSGADAPTIARRRLRQRRVD